MDRVLQVVLTGNATSLRGTLAVAARETKAFTREVEASNGRVAASAQKAGLSVKQLAAGAVAVAAAIGYAVVQAAKFDAAMRNVNSLAGLSERQFGRLSAQVLAMSQRLPQSAETLAQGLYDIVGSGFAAGDALTVLDAAATAASAGLTTTEVSAKAITAVINAYGLAAKDAADVSDVLFQTVNLGVLSFDDLASNIGDVVGSAAAAKIQIDEVGAAIATMTLTGISGAEATTSLNQLIQSMIKPSDALAEAYKELGYQSGAQALAQDGLRGVMEKLRGAYGDDVTALLHLFPNIRAARGALALMSAEGENYARVSGELEDKNKRQGVTARVLAEQMKSANMQFRLMKNGAEGLAISAGTKLLPAAIALMGGFRSLATWIGTTAGKIGHELTPAWHGLVQIGTLVWQVLSDMFEIGSTVLGVILKFGGGAVIGALNLLLRPLGQMAEFLSENEDAVYALSAAMLFLMLRAGPVQQALWRFVGTPIVLGISNLLSGVGSLAGLFSGGVTNALRTASTAMAGFLASAGPLIAVAAITYAITKVVAFASAAGDARKDVAQMWDAVGDAKNSAGRLEAVGGVIDGIRGKIRDLKSEMPDMNSVGGAAVGLNPLATIDLVTEQKKLKEYERALADAEKKQWDMQRSISLLGDQFHMTRDQVFDFADNALIPVLDAEGKITHQAINLADAHGKVAYQFGLMEHLKYGEAVAVAQQGLIEAMGVLADKASSAEDRIKAVKDALDALAGQTGDVFQANAKFQESVDGALKSMEGLTGAVLDSNGGLNAYTDAGRQAGKTLYDMAEQANDVVHSMLAQGATTEEVVKRDAEMRDSFIKTAESMGIGEDAAKKLADTILGVPETRKTTFEAAGVDANIAKIQAMQREIDRLKGKTVTIDVYARTVTSTTGDAGQVSVPLGFVGRGRYGLITAEKYAGGGVRGVSIQPDGSWTPKRWASGVGLPTVPMVAKEHGGAGLINWAEPGTGGEAFVPMGVANRAQSKNLVRYIAAQFGGVASFAGGGVHAPASAAGYRSAPVYVPVGGGGGGITVHSPITFAAPVYGENSMRRIAEDIVDTRDARLHRDLRSSR